MTPTTAVDQVDTGHHWLPQIPSAWSLVPAKSLFSDRREPSTEEDEHLTPSQKFGVVTQAEYMAITGTRVVLNLTGADNMKRVRPGDFVIHLRSFQGGIEWSRIPGKVSLAYTVLAPRRQVHGPYYRWLLKSDRYIQALRVTVNQLRDGQSIRYQDFGKIHLPLPPLGGQRAIADFLDRETALIDALIEKQTALIERLRERRSTSAEKLVSDLASHPVRKMKYLYRPSSAVNPGDVQVLSVYRDYGVIPKDSRADNINVTPLDLSRYLLVKPGWLVVNKMKAWQGSLGVSQHLGIVSPDYEVLVQTSTELDPDFVHEVLRSPVYAREFRVRSVGIRPIQWRLYWDQLGQVQVPLPPLSVQRELVARAVQERAEIDALIAKVERHVELARERRSALITAAVTGQIEVGA